MIPRFKPALGKEEWMALIKSQTDPINKFESDFAQVFHSRHAVAFPYGRSALWAFFNAMGIKDAEVIQPAYTCSVVAHATVLSGNWPVFVDADLDNYNMDLDLMRSAITPRTRVIIATHLFGCPMDINAVNAIAKEAETRFGQRLYVIQDCAHSFDAEWKGHSVINAGDGALFGLNISKQITSIFGGVFTTDNDEIAKKLRNFRNHHFTPKNFFEEILRAAYLPAAGLAFSDVIYGFTYWLQEKTSLLKGMTDAYHLDEKIHFPPDYLKQLSACEARIGRVQIRKYEDFKNRRREIAQQYFDGLRLPKTWVFPPQLKGATWSHFAIRVPNRDAILKKAAGSGVQLGQLIEYSVPDLLPYQPFKGKQMFPNSSLCSRSMINLPIYPGLKQYQIEDIISIINEAGRDG